MRARRWLGLVLLAAGCPRSEPLPLEAAAPAPSSAPAPAVAAAPDRSRSVVSLSCPQGEGPGFFIAPDRVVTRARFACEAPKVRLHDGRTLLGRLRSSQKDLDVAELEVSGGEGEPIPVADGLQLAETDDVLALPGGARGTVRSVARTRLGVPHFEVAFERLPAVGSLVLDARGAAVGLVTDATLVLPLEALGPAAGWAELLTRDQKAAALEVATLRRALQKPGLASALVDASGALHAVLLSRTAAPTVKLCSATVTPAWEPFRVAAWYDPAARELFQFIDKHDLDIGLSMSTVVVPPGACGAAELLLDGADPLLHQASVGKTELAMAATEPVRAPPKPGSAVQPPSPVPPPSKLTAADERQWRGRFAALREEQEQFELQLRDKQRFIEQADRAVRRTSMRTGTVLPVLTPDERERYDQYKRDLENADAERAAFQRRLDDLEREASNASVPREWRR